jgi:hypothetical protein
MHDLDPSKEALDLAIVGMERCETGQTDRPLIRLGYSYTLADQLTLTEAKAEFCSVAR